MRYLVLAAVLAIGCGEVDPAGGNPNGGAAGTTADATGAAGTTGQAGTTGSGGTGGAAPSCAIPADSISGTFAATLIDCNNREGQTFAYITSGQETSTTQPWTRTGYSSSPETAGSSTCTVAFYFQRVTTSCTERMNVTTTMPAI